MLRLSRLRPALASPAALCAIAFMLIALVTPWTINIPKVQENLTFGFETPLCWLALLALVGALLLPDLTSSAASVVAAELILIAWYAWATYLATTPIFSSQFNFVGTDIVGPSWYAIALGLLFAATVVARRFHDSDLPPSTGILWLAAIPGFGLVRIGKTARGLNWIVLVATSLLIASLASPIAPLFQPINGLADLPSALPTRSVTWIFLGAAALFAVLSFLDTLRAKRRVPQR